MRKLLYFITFVYSFFFFGFVFHTSTKPTILAKYTDKYFLMLLLLAALFIPFLLVCKYIFVSSRYTYKKRKLHLRPQHKIISLALVLIVVFFFAELHLRAKYPNKSGIWGNHIESFHPFLQNQATKHDNLYINSKGFRGDEIEVDKNQEVVRIFVLGGSTVLSPYVTYEKSSVKLLGDFLRKEYPDKNIEIQNAGNDWYTTEHSLIQYLFKIKDYNPNVVIMWHGINDLVRSCSPTTYGGRSFEADYSHFYGASSNLVTERFITRPFIKINSLLLEGINHTIQYNLYSDFKNKEPISQKISSFGGVPMKNFQSLASFERNLNSFMQILKNDNVKVIVGNQAHMYKQHSTSNELQKMWLLKSFCNESGIYPDIDSAISGITQFNQITRKAAENHKVIFVDLESQVPKSLKYFIDDVHTSENGDRKIAETLFRAIKHSQIIQ